MARIARVVPEVSLDRAFDYAIPAELDTQVTLGAKVRVPFKSRELVGYVVEFPSESSEFKGKLKPILEVLSKSAFLPAILIELAQWMAQYYCAPLTVALLSVLPQGRAPRRRRFQATPLGRSRSTTTLPEEAAAALKKARAQMAAWNYLQQNGPGWLADLTQVSSAAAWRASGRAQSHLHRSRARRTAIRFSTRPSPNRCRMP